MSTIYLTNDSELSQIADAIREKSGTSNNLVYPEGFVSAINNIPTGGGGGSVENGVVFIDYDGTIVESWKAADVPEKTALPINPSHDRLTAQGWNWTLANIKSFVSDHPLFPLVVGQSYDTTDGKSEFDITLNVLTGKTVSFAMSGTKNWGDGTSNTSTSHTYSNYGDYTITCNGTSIPAGSSSQSGIFGATSTNINRFICTAIRIGNKVASLGDHCFRRLNASYVTLPQKAITIGAHAFHDMSKIESLTFPSNITSIPGDIVNNCGQLKYVSLSKEVSSVGNGAFNACDRLYCIQFPDTMTAFANHYLYGCAACKCVVASKNVASIGDSTFELCVNLERIDFSGCSSVPTMGNINELYGIPKTCKIIVPDALYDTWKAATNWTVYADYIYKVSEVTGNVG